MATLVRLFGDITLAEDAVQDAFIKAIETWGEDGVPPNPAGWIVTTARNRAIDNLRREKRGRELYASLRREADMTSEAEVPIDSGVVEDDQLRLMFTCCHPSIRAEDQVALTLRLIGGLEIKAIADAFLVSESAMAKRLVRAKYKIKAASIPYELPEEQELPDRLVTVLAAIYLAYNTGLYDTWPSEVRQESIRLTRSLVQLMPGHHEIEGLLALLLLNESRAEARLPGSELVRLEHQDRSRWDRGLISEGQNIVRRCIAAGNPGPYQYQAAIQAIHSQALSSDLTNWSAILENYDHLYAIQPSSVVALNRAVVVAEIDGPSAALSEVETLRPDLDNYYLFHAVVGELLCRLGDPRAAASFMRASELAPNEREREHLELRQNEPCPPSA